MLHVPNSVPNKVFSFVRQNQKDKVFAVFNFSAEPQTVTFHESLFHGIYTEYMSGQPAELSASTQIGLQPWEYRIFVK
jgi:hypothetical protein